MASGDQLAAFMAMDCQPPASAFATLDTRNSISVQDFDAASEEALDALFILPPFYGGGNLSVKAHWMATSATSGDVVWGAKVERGTTDADADSFATEATATGTANGTSGIETVTSISVTALDGIAVGDRVRLRVSRKAADGADTMTGDAELVGLEVLEA